MSPYAIGSTAIDAPAMERCLPGGWKRDKCSAAVEDDVDDDVEWSWFRDGIVAGWTVVVLASKRWNVLQSETPELLLDKNTLRMYVYVLFLIMSMKLDFVIEPNAFIERNGSSLNYLLNRRISILVPSLFPRVVNGSEVKIKPNGHGKCKLLRMTRGDRATRCPAICTITAIFRFV